MKLGNRKVVIGGLTAIAFTSLTAFTNVTPDTTSDTNPFSTTPSVEYQSLYMAGSSGFGKYSTLFMPGKVTATVDAIIVDSTTKEEKKPLKAQAGIANVFSQNVTLDSLGTVSEGNEESIELKEDALPSDSVLKETDETQQVVESEPTKEQETVVADDTQNESVLEVVDSKEAAQSDDAQAKEVASEALQEQAKQEEVGNNDLQEEVNQPSKTQDNTQEQTDTKEADAKDSQEQEAKVEEESEWSDRVMADVEEAVNIRAEANEEAAVVGKLYKGAEASILEKGDEWTKISSGSVEEGYVKNEYLAFGEDAKSLAEQDGQLVATVNTDALRVRSEANEEASVLDLAENGEQLNAVSEDGDWVEVAYTSDSNGYVASQFVSVDYVLGKALTLDEIEAIEAEKKRKEAEERMAEIAASEDAALLAAVVRMEAGGESYEGKLAVASVVVNRMKSSRYPSSLSGVVYQSGQFPGAGSGKLAGILSGGVGGDCKKAAVEALSGLTNVDYLHFNSVSSIGSGGYVIGNHCFY